MKIIKPLRLGVLHRPWQWLGQQRLGVSVMALADMGPSPRLRPEPELWQLAARELADDDGLLDLAIPKACAEFLATGYAYTRHQPAKTACMVKIQVDDLEKSLLAFGDRFWANGKPTEPLPFEQLRLDWRHAYGGKGDAENPRGLGAHPIERHGIACHPLANIEPVGLGYSTPGERIKPDCFAPLDFCLNTHFKRMGKGYDDRWQQQDYPGFARDIDWHVFNRAARDQWWPRSPSLPLGKPWRIWNMHPENPLQEGRLPDWRARCFVRRAGGDEPLALEEVSLRATTVWFFPHLEQLVLIWQGSCAITEDDAQDISALMVAVETAAERRSPDHYQRVFQARGQKDVAAAHALREQDLVTESLIGPWLDTAPATETDALADNLARRGTRLRDAHRAALDKNANETPIAGPVAGPRPSELPEFMAAVEKRAAALQQRALEKAADLGANFTPAQSDAGPAHYHRMLALLNEQDARAANESHALVDDARATDAITDTAAARQGLHQLYRMSADTRPAAAPLSADAADAARRRLQNLLAKNRDLSGMDLTGADLHGLDLRGVNLRRALMESTCLDNCLLDDADLSEAMLAHASLANASLAGARLHDTCLTAARCLNTRFTGAHLNGVILNQATLSECCFRRSHINGIVFDHTSMERCRFAEAEINGCMFPAPDAAGLDFSRCSLEKVTFSQGRLQAACFNAAHLNRCSFIAMVLELAQFQEATLDSCVFTADARADGANFRNARLISCNLRQTSLENADFSLAQAENCDFSAASLAHARFTDSRANGCLFIRAELSYVSFLRADLIGALLQKSALAGADLREANLFRADLSLCRIDSLTQLGGAFTHQCKTLPRAPGTTP